MKAGAVIHLQRSNGVQPYGRTSGTCGQRQLTWYVTRVRKPLHLNVDRMARIALFAFLFLLCAVTWRKWGSLIIDCGREWYVPAAIAQGKRLYADIWYPYGPLIPYWHALLFRIFGAHLWILEGVGLSIVAAITWLLYSLARMFLPPPLAFAAGVAFLVQAFRLGNADPEFNYVLPYSYPADYGALMFVLLAWLLVRDAVEPKRWTWPAAGIIAGLESITKVEFGVFAWLLVAAAILLRSAQCRSVRVLVRAMMACIPGLLLVIGVYGWYVHSLGVRALFADNISVLPDSYFMKLLGKHWAYLTGSAGSWRAVGRRLLWAAAGISLTAGAIRLAAISRATAAVTLAAAFALSGFNLALVYASQFRSMAVEPWLLDVAWIFYFNRGMLFASGLLAIWILAGWRKRKPEPQDAASVLLLTAAVLLGSRTTFKLDFGGYSIFYNELEFIGYLLVLWKVALWLRVPDRPQFWGGTAAALCCGLVSLGAISYREVHARSFAAGSARGTIYTLRATGRPFGDVLHFLETAQARRETFAVWPEEAALYYFTGATAPSRWWNVMPGVLPPGEPSRRFLEELDAQRIKYIVLSDRSTPEYGLPVFGVDYDQEIYRWLNRNYRVVRTFGNYQRVKPWTWAAQVWERIPEGQTALR